MPHSQHLNIETKYKSIKTAFDANADSVAVSLFYDKIRIIFRAMNNNNYAVSVSQRFHLLAVLMIVSSLLSAARFVKK